MSHHSVRLGKPGHNAAACCRAVRFVGQRTWFLDADDDDHGVELGLHGVDVAHERDHHEPLGDDRDYRALRILEDAFRVIVNNARFTRFGSFASNSAKKKNELKRADANKAI